MAGTSSQHGQGELAHADDHVVLIVGSLVEKLKNASPLLFGSQCCIHRVPERLRKINELAYTPKMVSIGPFHRGKIELSKMEGHKKHYILALLTRATTTDTELSALLSECFVSIKKMEKEARDCYSERINLSSDDFVEMMVFDGLFIIELLWRKAGVVKTNGQDPLIDDERKLWTLVCDLVKLENQLPMIVLNCLFKHVGVQDNHIINMLVLDFFDILMPRDASVRKNCSVTKVKHLLDLLGQTFVGLSNPVDTENNSLECIPNVTELKEIGMKFKKGSLKNTFVDIEFKGGGMLGFCNSALEFSPVTIQDRTYSLLGNLIAFEEYGGGGHRVNHITSYALLMHRLLNSAKDVRLLRNQNIITNYLGKDEDVSDFYKKFAREVTRSKFYYSTLCDQVNSYCNSRWRVWRRKFTWHNLFTYWINPANVIALISVVFTIYAAFIALESLNDNGHSKGSK